MSTDGRPGRKKVGGVAVLAIALSIALVLASQTATDGDERSPPIPPSAAERPAVSPPGRSSHAFAEAVPTEQASLAKDKQTPSAHGAGTDAVRSEAARELELWPGATLTRADVLPVVVTLMPHFERCMRDHGEPLRTSDVEPLRFRMRVVGTERGTQVRDIGFHGGRSPSPYLDACFSDVTEEVPLPDLRARGEATVSSPLTSVTP